VNVALDGPFTVNVTVYVPLTVYVDEPGEHDPDVVGLVPLPKDHVHEVSFVDVFFQATGTFPFQATTTRDEPGPPPWECGPTFVVEL
jgi:hypothetical protein